MNRRAVRPLPAGLPKFKLDIPEDTPVQIFPEKVDANDVGNDNPSGSPTGKNAGGVSGLIGLPQQLPPTTIPNPMLRPVTALTQSRLAEHTASILRDASGSAPPSDFVSIKSNLAALSSSSSNMSMKRAIIQCDDSLVSPHVSMGFHDPRSMSSTNDFFSNEGGPSTGVSPTTGAIGGFPGAGEKKFYQVSQSNIYVFVEGAPLVRDDGSFASQQQRWSELVGGESTEVNKGIAGGGSVNSRTTTTTVGDRERTNSSDDLLFQPSSGNFGTSDFISDDNERVGGGRANFERLPSNTSEGVGMGTATGSNTTAAWGEGSTDSGPAMPSRSEGSNEYWGSPSSTTRSATRSPAKRRQQLHQNQLLLSPKRAPLNSQSLSGLSLGKAQSGPRKGRKSSDESKKDASCVDAKAPPAASTRADRTIYLNQLDLLEKVGSGQQGSVFKCKHKETETVYALKKLSLSALQDNPDPIERQARKASIVREIRMLTDCRHVCRNLVALHNAYFQNDELMVLMEWMGTNVEEFLKIVARVPQDNVQHLARETLQRSFGGDKNIPVKIKSCGSESAKLMEKARINRGTSLPEVIAAIITADVLKGLVYLHKNLRIVHTDLKPANILLTIDNTESKIADFGCSMRLGEDGKVRYKGVTLGTKLYMPPDRVNTLMMAGPEEDNSLLLTVPFSGGMTSAGPSAAAAMNSTAAYKPSATIEAFRESMSEANNGAFDEKADIWSFGIVLLELVNGCHPCQALARDNYWNYANDLRFQKMIRPSQMSDLLYDVLQKCLAVDPSNRPSAEEILKMPFYQKYKDIDRKKFALFVERLKKSAASFELESRRKEIQKQVQSSLTATTTTTYHGNQSKNLWAKHNNYLDRSGLDANNFPSLPGM